MASTSKNQEISRKLITKDGVQQYEVKSYGTGEGGGKAKFTRYEMADPNVVKTREKGGKVSAIDKSGKATPVANYDSFRTAAENMSQMRDDGVAGTTVPTGAVPAETVDTSIPNPSSVKVGPQTVSPEAQQAVQQGYVSSADEYQNAVTAGQDLASRMRTGLATAKASGAPAPDTQGQAALTMSSSLPNAQDFSHVDTLLSEDQGFNDLQNLYKDYFSPESQKTTLTKEYKRLYKQSGLDDLDEEILDAKTIIEGTEDDIRNEIQAAGGFGTDSQVQALASSRNKVLLKNYNNLVAMREMKQSNFDTMLSLAERDRQYADQRAEQMLNYQFKVMDYKNKFVENTRSQLNSIANTLGYQALYNAYSKDPRQLAFAEQILGTGTGSLRNLAGEESRIAAASIVPSGGTRGGGGGSTVTAPGATGYFDASGKPLKLTATQIDAITGYDSTVSGANRAKALVDKGVKSGPIQSLKLQGAKFLNKADPDQMELEQVLTKIKADYLKALSGAAVSESEQKRLAKLLPDIGDQESVIKSKLETLRSSATEQKKNYLRTIGGSENRGNVVVGPDGREYEIID